MKTNSAEIIGNRFGRFTVLSVRKQARYWIALCKCDCGNQKEVKVIYIRNGESRSCGCFRADRSSERATKPVTPGERYSRLTVVSTYKLNHQMQAVCICDCGAEKHVSMNKLRTGGTKSCGCLARESVKTQSITHGDTGTVEHDTWRNIKQRCSNGDSAYGGRGIRICDRWKYSYSNFLADVGRRPSPIHSIGRLDNDGDYKPGNVEWQTPEQQARNKRNTHLITFDGETKSVADWAEQYNIHYQSLLYRLYNKWPITKAFFERNARYKGRVYELSDRR